MKVIKRLNQDNEKIREYIFLTQGPVCKILRRRKSTNI